MHLAYLKKKMSTQKLAELVHYHHRPLLKAAETGQFCLAEVKVGSHDMSRQQKIFNTSFLISLLQTSRVVCQWELTLLAARSSSSHGAKTSDIH